MKGPTDPRFRLCNDINQGKNNCCPADQHRYRMSTAIISMAPDKKGSRHSQTHKSGYYSPELRAHDLPRLKGRRPKAKRRPGNARHKAVTINSRREISRVKKIIQSPSAIAID